MQKEKGQNGLPRADWSQKFDAFAAEDQSIQAGQLIDLLMVGFEKEVQDGRLQNDAEEVEMYKISKPTRLLL